MSNTSLLPVVGSADAGPGDFDVKKPTGAYRETRPEPLVEDIQNYAQNIVDTVREPLLILDATLRVRSANRAFYQTFHVSPAETEAISSTSWATASGTSPTCGPCSRTSSPRARSLT